MEALIELVQARPCLYDVTHADFKNRDKKMEGWNEIAELMGKETGNFWRFKWNCLKENYAKYKKINLNPSNHTYRKYRNWPWAEHMRFMEDFPNKRNSRSIKVERCSTSDEKILITNVSGSDNNSPDIKCLKNTVDEAEFADELSEFLEISKSNGNLIENQVYVIEQTSSGGENMDHPVEDIQVIIQKNDDGTASPKNKKVKFNESETFSEYREKKRKKAEYDEVEHFFMSYAHSFKRLPSRLQQVVKLEMVTLFARYELQAEMLNSNM